MHFENTTHYFSINLFNDNYTYNIIFQWGRAVNRLRRLLSRDNAGVAPKPAVDENGLPELVLKKGSVTSVHDQKDGELKI